MSDKPTFESLVSNVPDWQLSRSFDPEDRDIEWVITFVADMSTLDPEDFGKRLCLPMKDIRQVRGRTMGNYFCQREGLLQKWMSVKGQDATVEALLKLLYESSRYLKVQDICQGDTW